MKINWTLGLNEEEIISELKSFFKRGFKWRNGRDYCQIWTPFGFFIEYKDIANYIEDTKPKFGDKEYIEMLDTATLVAVLNDAGHYNRYDLWDSKFSEK